MTFLADFEVILIVKLCKKNSLQDDFYKLCTQCCILCFEIQQCAFCLAGWQPVAIQDLLELTSSFILLLLSFGSGSLEATWGGGNNFGSHCLLFLCSVVLPEDPNTVLPLSHL